MSHPNATWLSAYLKPLIGATIVDVHATEDDFDTWPVLSVTLKGESKVRELEIGRDEEGNGPGFIFGLDHPE